MNGASGHGGRRRVGRGATWRKTGVAMTIWAGVEQDGRAAAQGAAGMCP